MVGKMALFFTKIQSPVSGVEKWGKIEVSGGLRKIGDFIGLHHGYHAFLGVDSTAAPAAAVRGGLLIALRADMFAAEEVRDVVGIVPGKAMALDVVTAGGTLTVINVHGPGSGGDSWASKVSFWADLAMYAAAKSAGGTRPVLIGGEGGGGLQRLVGVPGTPHHEEVCGIVGAVWVSEGRALGRGRPSAHT